MYKKRGRKIKKPNKAEFEYMYYILDMSAKEMAEKLGVKEHTIHTWAWEYRKEDQLSDKQIFVGG